MPADRGVAGGALRTPEAAEVAGEPDLVTALRLFARHVPEDHRYALYALRCALGHEYTLYNEGRGDPRLRHYFNLDPESETKLVELPARPWNGCLDEHRQGGPTVVGLRRLGDLVEQTVRDLEGARPGQLLIAPAVGGPKGLLTRYTFTYFTGA